MKNKLLSLLLVIAVLMLTGCSAEQRISEELKRTGSNLNQKQNTEDSEQSSFETEYVSEDIDPQTDEFAESEKIILEYKYAELLARISLGGKWPEETNEEIYHDELSEIQNADNDLQNYFTIVDLDGTGKEHLLIKTVNSIRDYYIDVRTGELQKNDFTDFGGSIEWTELSAEYYRIYTDRYIQYLMERQDEGDSGNIGSLFIQSDWDSQAMIEQISEITDALFVQINEGYYEGACEGEVVLAVEEIDGMYLTYKNRAVEGVNIFGVAPGMHMDEAKSVLEDFGFFRDENQFFFITGRALGNFGVYLATEGDEVREITLSHYNAYILDF